MAQQSTPPDHPLAHLVRSPFTAQLCLTGLQLCLQLQPLLLHPQQLLLLLEALVLQLLCLDHPRAAQDPHLAQWAQAGLAPHHDEVLGDVGDCVEGPGRWCLTCSSCTHHTNRATQQSTPPRVGQYHKQATG
jgi:hypothetical protein